MIAWTLVHAISAALIRSDACRLSTSPYFSSISSTRVRHASRAGHTRPATWPQRHVVTARWTRAPRGPARHVSPAWARSPRQPALATSAAGNFSPFFAILTKKFLKKSIKIQIKIGKNSIKIQKFIFLKIQLLFNPNFLHWITNSFLFISCHLKYVFKKENKDELKFH